VNQSNIRSDIKAIYDIYKREEEVMSRRSHYRGKIDEAAIDTLSSETHHKSLISLSEETSE
jgi:hypothetical protein